MSEMTAKLFREDDNGQLGWTAAGGYTWSTLGDELVWSLETGVASASAYMQFRPRLPLGSSVSNATLKLRVADSVASGGDLKVALIDRLSADLAADPHDDPELASITVSDLPAWTSDEWVSIDVTALLSAFLALGGYQVASRLTLRIDSTTSGAPERAIRAFDLLDGNASAPALTITYALPATEPENPYTKLIRALWDMLEADPHFCALVRPGNRIKLLGPDRDPIKETVSEADRPEVRIVIVSSTPHPLRTSNSSSTAERLEIQCATADQRYTAGYHDLKWAVYRALAWWPDVLGALRWNGTALLRRAANAAVREGVSESDMNRGIIGWSALWAMDFELWFETDKL